MQTRPRHLYGSRGRRAARHLPGDDVRAAQERRDPGPADRLSVDHRSLPVQRLARKRRCLMARGSVRKRCQCRDAEGRRVKQCRKAHGSWSFVIDAGTNPTTGKRRQLTRSGFRTRDEADEAMTKELAALDSGSWTDDQGMKVGDWLDQWLDEFADRDRSPKTLALYRGHVVSFWRPRLGQLRLRDLRRGHVEAALRALGQRQTSGRAAGNSGHYAEQRSAATIDSYRRTLRAALSAARRRELIHWNPADGRIDAIPDRVERGRVHHLGAERDRPLPRARGRRPSRRPLRAGRVLRTSPRRAVRPALVRHRRGRRWAVRPPDRSHADQRSGETGRPRVPDLWPRARRPPVQRSQVQGRPPLGAAGVPARRALASTARQADERVVRGRLPRPRPSLLPDRRSAAAARPGVPRVRRPHEPVRATADQPARHAARRVLTHAVRRRARRGGADDPGSLVTSGHTTGVRAPSARGYGRAGRGGHTTTHDAAR